MIQRYAILYVGRQQTRPCASLLGLASRLMLRGHVRPAKQMISNFRFVQVTHYAVDSDSTFVRLESSRRYAYETIIEHCLSSVFMHCLSSVFMHCS
jgi:hypothetical protein